MYHPINKLILCLQFFTVASLPLLSQEPSYKHYTIQDGLPSMTVYCMAQDSRGFMWFGTNNGLARFDGHRFKVFTIRDGLPDPEVLTMFEDSQQRLWVSCFQKQPCYIQDGVFFTAANDSLLKQINMKTGTYTFHEDGTGNIWIAGDNEYFCRWRQEGLNCYPNPISGANVSRILSINSQLLAVNGHYLFDLTDPANPLLFDSLYSKSDSVAQLHVATNEDLVATNCIGETMLISYSDNRLKNLHKFKTEIFGNPSFDNAGKLWLATVGNGAFRYDIKDDKLILTGHFLSGKQNSNCFEDKHGTFWFTTLNDGVYALHKQSPISFSSNTSPVFKSKNISTINKLPNGSIIAGDDKGNSYTFIKGQWRIDEINNKDGFNKIRQIIPISETDYIFLSDDGLFSKEGNPISVKVRQVTYPGTGALKTGLYNKGKIWLGSSGGLTYWTDDPLQATRPYFERISALCSDSQGNVWAGGLNGVLSEKDSFKIVWEEKFPAIGGRVISLQPAGENAIWVANPEFGLVKVFTKNGEITYTEAINEKIEKPIQDIQSIFVGNDQTVWLATNSGVYAVDEQLHVWHFSEDDGLSSNDVNAVLIDADTLWAATTSGISKIHLNQEMEQGDFPTYISGISYLLGNNRVEIDLIPVRPTSKELVLPAGTSMLDIELSAIHYKSRGNIEFELITTEHYLPLLWLTWDNLFNSLLHQLTTKGDTVTVIDHSRNFGVHVPAGRFRTKATARLKSGVRSHLPAEQIFTVPPFWYQTIWFFLSVAGLTGYLAWRFYRQKTQYERLQTAASNLQLQAIKAQMNPHFVGNSINAIQQFFYPPDPAKASQYIATFTSLLRQTMLLSEMPFIAFKEELGFVSDYMEMVKLRYGDRLEYRLLGTAHFQDEMPFPAMILQPILENATIHGLAPEGAALIVIDFQKNNNRMECHIMDNGEGIDISQKRKKLKKANHESKGISLLNKKIEVLNKMYALDLTLDYQDLSKADPTVRGTKATLSFSLGKMWNVQIREEG